MFRAIVLVVVTLYAARFARSSFEYAATHANVDPHVRLIVGRTISISILVVGVATILDALGIPLATILTFIGVVGIAVSLALQDILKNFFAGTYLLFERPFRIGDEISVKDQRGKVETIGIRTTTLRTVDNALILVPNAMMFAEIVGNRTTERKASPANAQTPAAAASATAPVSDPISERAAAASGAGATAAASGAAIPASDGGPVRQVGGGEPRPAPGL
ncbi:MAG: mechanosensitive ion channel [Chloroflexi bacterium]|nr:mechanosensitive ion channel [Chloroflexota bacterium]